jgi:uncharacterized protein YkwD
MLLLVNASRSIDHQLILDNELSKRAQIRAEYLCANSQWSHKDWISSFDGLKWRYAGENLAKGFDNVGAAEAALLASPTHKANIVNTKYDKLGVGASCGIIVQLFNGK